jgi:hypothetical protein
MLCEESIIIVEARNALSIPYNTKYATPMKTQNNTGKIDKHCTNYGMITMWRHVKRRKNKP